MHLKQIIIGLTTLGALTAAAPAGNGVKGMRHEVREETAPTLSKASVPNIPQNITNLIGQDASNQLIQLAEQDLLTQVKAHMARSADLQAIKNNIRLNSLAAQFPRVNTVLVVVTNIVDARNPSAVNKRYMVNNLFVDNGSPEKYQVVYATDAQTITVSPTAAPTPTAKNLVESFTTTTTTLGPTETPIFPPADPSNLPTTGNDPNGTNNPDVNNPNANNPDVVNNPDLNNPDVNNPDVNNPLNNPTIINDPNAIPNNPLFPNSPTFLPPGATPGTSPIIPGGVTSPFTTIPGGQPLTDGNPLTTIPGGVTNPLILPPGTTTPTTFGGVPPTTFGNPTFNPTFGAPTTFGSNTFGSPAIITTTTQTITNILPLTSFSTFSTQPSSLFLDPTTAFLLPFASLPPTSATALILPSDPASLIFANQVDLLGVACLGLNGGTTFGGGQQHLFGSAEQALQAQLAVLLQGQQQGLQHVGGFPPVVLGGHGVNGVGVGGTGVEGVLVNGVRFRVVEGKVEVDGGSEGWKRVEEESKAE